MTVQMYDVCVAEIDNTDEAKFMMRAPLSVIVNLLSPWPDQLMKRIETETRVGGMCVVNHNGRGQWANKVHAVMKARGNLWETIPTRDATELMAKQD